MTLYALRLKGRSLARLTDDDRLIANGVSYSDFVHNVGPLIRDVSHYYVIVEDIANDLSDNRAIFKVIVRAVALKSCGLRGRTDRVAVYLQSTFVERHEYEAASISRSHWTQLLSMNEGDD